MKLATLPLLAVLIGMSVGSAMGQALPIPDGFDFPAAQSDLEKLRDDHDTAGMRKHGWAVFAGLTQPAPGGEPIWETWYSSVDVMTTGPRPQGLLPRARVFRQPRQFRGDDGLPALQSPGASLAELVLFNEESRKHIRTEKYNLKSTLTSINSSWPTGIPVQDRKLKDFPAKAMSLKTAWFLVKATGLTAMPIWDEKPRQPTYPPLAPETWERIVVVDPSRDVIPPGERVNQNHNGKSFPNSRVVPLSAFYSFKLTQEIVDSLRTATIFGDAPQVGDYLALVGFHYTTKEIPDWVWATLWWHDEPDQAPYGSGRPDTVRGVWRNYKMDVALSMDVPQESDGSAKVIFNPWLESQFPNGANSNCMTCHQRAVWPAVSFLPVTRGALPPNAPLFQQRTKMDFLWSIIFESQ